MVNLALAQMLNLLSKDGLQQMLPGLIMSLLFT